MPRDPRPFVTYPINYTGHPRVESLSDPAFRVWHEMMDHSRVHGLDGVILQPVAEKRWPKKALAELVRGVDERPLVSLSDGAYRIRSYDEHQFTTADAQALSKKRADAGREGGKAKAAARQAPSNGLASATPGGWQNLAESELDLTELDLTDIANLPASSPDSTVRAEGLDHQVVNVIRERNEAAITRAAELGIKDPTAVWDRLERTLAGRITLPDAVRLAAVILDRSPTFVSKPDAYIATACRQSADEVRTWAEQIDVQIGAAA